MQVLGVCSINLNAEYESIKEASRVYSGDQQSWCRFQFLNKAYAFSHNEMAKASIQMPWVNMSILYACIEKEGFGLGEGGSQPCLRSICMVRYTCEHTCHAKSGNVCKQHINNSKQNKTSLPKIASSTLMFIIWIWPPTDIQIVKIRLVKINKQPRVSIQSISRIVTVF